MNQTKIEHYQALTVTIGGGVAEVLVDSPPVNAMGRSVLESLAKVAERLATDDTVRVIILTGSGDKAFMAGADINEFEQIRAQPNGMKQHTAWAGGVMAAWSSLPQPVIAAVQASAVGGGLEIA